MPLQKLSEIEEKLQKDYIDIKKRYIKLKRCKYADYFSFNFKNNFIVTINRFKFFKSNINYSFINCPHYR